jgi:hypothetical protein
VADVQRQRPDGSWQPAEPLPAPWLVRLRTGELNGPVQRVTAVVVLGVLQVVHLGADVARHRHRQPRRH